jgi:hypothetical protein
VSWEFKNSSVFIVVIFFNSYRTNLPLYDTKALKIINIKTYWAPVCKNKKMEVTGSVKTVMPVYKTICYHISPAGD